MVNAPDPPLDTVFDLLSARPRRVALYRLADGRTATVEDLVDTVADGDADEDDRRRVRVALEHVHLPRLADAGAVSVDDGTDRVRYRASTTLGAAIRWARERDREGDEGGGGAVLSPRGADRSSDRATGDAGRAQREGPRDDERDRHQAEQNL
jgi:hypothetical protein